jgi:hypothetical protein
LKAGIEIYEYQPQILHTKLLQIDGAVYAGSSNLDIRSLNLNYELMLRLEGPSAAGQAQAIFDRLRQQCHKIDLASWQKAQTLWQRWKNHWAHFLLARIDPFVALQQFQTLRRVLTGRRKLTANARDGCVPPCASPPADKPSLVQPGDEPAASPPVVGKNERCRGAPGVL